MGHDIVFFVAYPTQRDPTTVCVDRGPNRRVVVFEAIVPQPGVGRHAHRHTAGRHSETNRARVYGILVSHVRPRHRRQRAQQRHHQRISGISHRRTEQGMEASNNLHADIVRHHHHFAINGRLQGIRQQKCHGETVDESRVDERSQGQAGRTKHFRSGAGDEQQVHDVGRQGPQAHANGLDVAH